MLPPVETVRSRPGHIPAPAYHRAIARPGSDASRLDVLLALTAADLRARYGRGPLRFLKWVFDPFALVGVYLVLVTFVLDRPGFAPGLSLACAVVPFQLIMMTLINAMSSVTTRRSIILNMSFDRTLLPVSAALTEGLGFITSYLLFPVMMVAYSVRPTFELLWLPVVTLVTLVFAAAISVPGVLFGLWFRDLRPLALSLVRTMFFLGSGLVPLAATSGSVDQTLKINPFTAIFESYRDVLMFGSAPRVWELAYPLGLSAALVALLGPLYVREQRQFAKVVE